MRKTLLPLIVIAPLAAWTAFIQPMTVQPQSKLWVEGTSTVRSFSCKAPIFTADVQARKAGAVTAVAGGESAVASAEVTVPATKLDCGNGTMNEHMAKAIKSKEFQTITFKLSGYELAKGAEGITAKLSGALTLGGVTKPMTFTALTKAEGGLLRVTGSTTVKMSDHGLKAPTLMMGTMKVNENVKVNFDIYLKD